jgi:hypothetical protein
MDFKGDETVSGCGAVIAPWTACDEASGAPLRSSIHTLKVKGNRKGLTVRDVQRNLRYAFTRWGLPDALRMDRDSLFVGSTRLEWPGTLLLWLVGLGIQPLINRPFRPTDNATVERYHRTWRGDVLIGQSFTDVGAVQRRSDQALEDRCFHLPSRHRGCHGRPPAEAYPELLTPRRAYQPERERTLFQLDRVDAYLAQWAWRRQVDSTGKISLANRNHRIGRAYRGQMVKVHFDPDSRDFVVTSVANEELARLQLVEVSLDYILGEGV